MRRSGILTLKNQLSPEDFLTLYNRNFYVLPRHLLESYGPCIYESEIVGSQIVFQSNPDYFLGTPGFGKLVVNVIASADTLSSLISGELDIFSFGNGISTQDDKKIAEASGFNVIESKARSGFVEIILNNSSIDDARIRRAMNFALDKAVLAEAGTQGLGSPSASYVLPGSEYYNTDLSVSRDLDQAKQLLAEAGYDSGRTFKIAIGESRSSLAALIQQQWAEAGIQVEITTVDVATMFTGLKEGKYDIGISGHQGTSYPLWFANNFSSNVKNDFSITDPAYDSWREKIFSERDSSGKKQLIRDYQAFVFDQAPFIPLWHAGSLFVESGSVRNVDYEAAGMCNDNVWEWVKE